LQAFMGLLDHHVVAGRDGLENERWRALEVHNTLVDPIEKQNRKGEKNKAVKIEQLPRIYRAIQIVKFELNPPEKGEDGEGPEKPTGAKRAELVKKINTMQDAFDTIISQLIERVLWGGGGGDDDDDNGLVDLLLDGISTVAAARFARKASVHINHALAKGKAASKTSASSRYSRAMVLEEVLEPKVSTMPRGWLNSGKDVESSLKRVPKSKMTADHTQETATALKRFMPPVRLHPLV